MNSLKIFLLKGEMENLEAAGNNIFKGLTVNRRQVFKIIDCDGNSPVYFNVLKSYELLLDEFYKKIQPFYEFAVEEKKFMQCSHIIYAGITLGGIITEYISYLFESGDYMKAVIINAMCDDYIMQADNALKIYIKDYCESIGINGVKTYMPHENIDAGKTKDIADKLKRLSLKTNESFALEPVKSLVFIISADERKCGNISHDCSVCGKNCKWSHVIV